MEGGVIYIDVNLDCGAEPDFVEFDPAASREFGFPDPERSCLFDTRSNANSFRRTYGCRAETHCHPVLVKGLGTGIYPVGFAAEVRNILFTNHWQNIHGGKWKEVARHLLFAPTSFRPSTDFTRADPEELRTQLHAWRCPRTREQTNSQRWDSQLGSEVLPTKGQDQDRKVTEVSHLMNLAASNAESLLQVTFDAGFDVILREWDADVGCVTGDVEFTVCGATREVGDRRVASHNTPRR